MSGVPTPPVIVEAFATNGTKNTIPQPSQVATDIALASLDTGFPAATMEPITSGGKPPYGADMNGILFESTSHDVWQQAGLPYPFNSTLSTYIGGYNVGAVLASVSVPGLMYYNTTANNVNDPDVTLTGWLPFWPAAESTTQALTLASGTTHDQAITAGIGFLDITANAAGSTLDGIVAPKYAQLLVISSVGTGVLTLGARTGSTAANQFRLAAALTFPQWGSQSFRYSLASAIWVPL